MNIYIISGTFPRLHCGVGDYTYCLCSELKKYDLILNVITTKSSQIEPLDGVNIIQLIENWDFSSLFSLLRFFKKNHADIIHIQYPTQSYKNKAMINILPIFLKLFFPGTVLIVTMHDVATAHIFNKLRAVPFFIFSDKIILTVEEEKKYLSGKLPFLRKKLEVVPVASNIKPVQLNAGEREKIRQKLGVKENETLISSFGYILPKKEMPVLLRSLKLLAGENFKVKLLVISEFSPETNKYHRRLRDLVGELALEGSVLWAGYCSREEVSQYLLSSDLCVQLYGDGISYRRGSFLAALGHGLAVVTSGKKLLPEGLKDQENILAVSHKNAGEVAEAVKKLIASEQLKKELGLKAKELSGRFSYGAIAKKHFELYGNISKKKHCGKITLGKAGR